MNLANTFYITGIIFHIFALMLFIGIVILLIYIKQKLAHIQEEMENKMRNMFRFTAERGADIVADFGINLAHKAAKKIRKIVKVK